MNSLLNKTFEGVVDNTGKHPEFFVRQQTPFNGGPPLSLLVRNQITPTGLFFVRNHGNIPEVNIATYRFEVTGQVRRPLSVSLDELQGDFPIQSLFATLQCAGNRREQMMAYRPIPNELGWGSEAISHAVWTGVPLRALLLTAGVQAGEDLHVEFTGLDETERLGQRFQFAGSIPLRKALASEVLLAYAMNGKSLTPVHGYPLRVIVPGYIGARSVKWLQRITILPSPSENYFQAHAYRLFPPDVTPETVEWETGLMLGEMPVTSVICTPAGGEIAHAGEVEVRGYAFTGGARTIARVELSKDGGQTWQQTCLEKSPQLWTWQLWHARLRLAPGSYPLVVRAIDTAANAQPSEVSQVWNFKGYMNNAWHRQTLVVV